MYFQPEQLCRQFVDLCGNIGVLLVNNPFNRAFRVAAVAANIAEEQSQIFVGNLRRRKRKIIVMIKSNLRQRFIIFSLTDSATGLNNYKIRFFQFAYTSPDVISSNIDYANSMKFGCLERITVF